MRSSIRDVPEIIEISESRHTPDKMAYQHIIKQVDKLIRSRALEQHRDASFEGPGMILFKPHYDRDQLTHRVYRHYRRIGFRVSLDNYTMNMYWGKNDPNDDGESHGNVDEEEEDNEDETSEDAEDETSDEEVPDKKIVVNTAPVSLAKRVSKIR